MKKTLKNTTHLAKVGGLSDQGLGIATIENKPVYIPNALPGETVEFKIIKENRTYAIGKNITLHTTSPDRVIETCPIASLCGGCQLQHLAYPQQLTHKVSYVHPLPVDETHPCPILFETRNKAQFAITQHNDGSIQIGLYATHSHRVIDTPICPIQSPLINSILKDIRSFIFNYTPSIYNESTQTGSLRHVVIRSSDYENKVMIAFVCHTRDLTFETACTMAFTTHPLVGSLLINVNANPGDTILGKDTYTLYGQSEMVESIAGNLFYFNLHTFIQSNRHLTETLYRQIKHIGSFKQTDHVIDLYCGIGTITQYIATHVASIIGIEENSDSIRLADKSLSLSTLTNCSFIEGKVEHSLSQIESVHIDTLILDPPRKGCHPQVLEFIIQKKIQQLIYVSCNPVSLKRDLDILNTHYTIETLHAVDMFPHTTHLETITRLILTTSE